MHHRIKHVFQIDNNPDQLYVEFFVQFDEHVDQNQVYQKKQINSHTIKVFLPEDRFQ